MISRVCVRNFQSLKDIDIELGSFTVIVGNSSSGKSALVRSLKAISSNIRGSSFVTVGNAFSSISLESQEWKITLEKGENHGSYKLHDITTGDEKEYTKLQGEVPKDIVLKLGMSPTEEGKSVNFAGERDSPYLLDDSGQQVARTLGDLTNVSTILEAVREANRRRTNANSTLKVRQEDLEELKRKLPKFKNLPFKRKAIEEAEVLLNSAKSLKTKIEVLKELVGNLEKVETEIVIPNLPDLNMIELKYAKYIEYKTLLKNIQRETGVVVRTKNECAVLDSTIPQIEQEYRDVLIEAGTCPVCGAST